MFCGRKYAAYARIKCGLFCFLYFCLNKKKSSAILSRAAHNPLDFFLTDTQKLAEKVIKKTYQHLHN